MLQSFLVSGIVEEQEVGSVIYNYPNNNDYPIYYTSLIWRSGETPFPFADAEFD